MQISVITGGPGIFFVPSFVNMLYFSYTSGVNNDKLFLIYNDTPKNLTLKDPMKVKPVKKVSQTVPLLCTIDLASGKSATKQFFDPKVVKNYIKTKVRYQKDYKSDIISIAQDKGIYQIVRVKLDSK